MTKNGPVSGVALVNDISATGTRDPSGRVSAPSCASARQGSFAPRHNGPATGGAPPALTAEVV